MQVRNVVGLLLTALCTLWSSGSSTAQSTDRIRRFTTRTLWNVSPHAAKTGAAAAAVTDQVENQTTRGSAIQDSARSLQEELALWNRLLQMDSSLSLSMPLVVPPAPTAPAPTAPAPSPIPAPTTPVPPPTPAPTTAVIVDPPTSTTGTILDVVVAESDLSTLVVAATTAGLQDALASEGPLTLLAPINDAFAAIDPTLLAELLEPAWINHLQAILLLHVIPVGTVLSTDLTDGMTAPTLMEDLTVDLTNGVSFVGPVNAASVVAADLLASNGVVHKIDRVLLPTFVTQTLVDVGMADPNFSTLVELVVAAELDATLATGGDFTILAPTNDAFAALPSDLVEAVVADVELLRSVLLYHVIPEVVPSQLLEDGDELATALPGTTVLFAVSSEGLFTFNEVPALVLDVLAFNGIVHVLSGVLLPPTDDDDDDAAVVDPPVETPVSPPTPAPTTAVELPPTSAGTVVDIVVADEDLSTLVTAVMAAGLVDALSGPGPLTVLAPDNAAFAALGSLVQQLLQPEFVVHLRTVLLVHVLPLNLISTDISDGSLYPTLVDDLLLAGVDSAGVTFTGEVPGNTAIVTAADLIAGNGVVHKIDQVLVPLALTLTLVDVAPMAGLTTVVELVVAAGLEETLRQPDATLTLLAPTDEAFAALPTEVLNALEQDVNLLRNYLMYHVLTGLYPSELLVDGTDVATAFGDFTVTVGVSAVDGVTMNGVPVLQADWVAGNGLVHVIDSVLVV